MTKSGGRRTALRTRLPRHVALRGRSASLWRRAERGYFPDRGESEHVREARQARIHRQGGSRSSESRRCETPHRGPRARRERHSASRLSRGGERRAGRRDHYRLSLYIHRQERGHGHDQQALRQTRHGGGGAHPQENIPRQGGEETFLRQELQKIRNK